MNILKIKGTYKGLGKILLDNLETIEWQKFSKEKVPEFPIGLRFDIEISISEEDLTKGLDGSVWATYDLRQAEIIQSTLIPLQINSEIKTIDLLLKEIYLIKINAESDISKAIDFIWKENGGLRLKPDWSYPENEINKSFEQWLSGE